MVIEILTISKEQTLEMKLHKQFQMKLRLKILTTRLHKLHLNCVQASTQNHSILSTSSMIQLLYQDVIRISEHQQIADVQTI